jgi:Tfp pilus assembly protein PilF
MTYSLMPNLFVVSPEEGYTKAKELAEKALSLDDTLENAHLALGWSLAIYDHAWSESENAFIRAIEFAPNSAYVHSRYGWFLSWLGRHDEALRELRLASSLDPVLCQNSAV